MAGRRMRLAERLVWERDHHVDHAMFYWMQIQLSFNSNHMEGSTLTAAQTAQIFETGRFLTDKDEQITLDDASRSWRWPRTPTVAVCRSWTRRIRRIRPTR